MSTDEELLAEHVRGNEAAFAELTKRYQQELFTFLQRFVYDAAAAEDLFQEAFFQVYKNAGMFDPERRFRPWLFTIAANKARDYLRAQNRRSTQSLDSQAGTDENSNSFVDLLDSEAASPQEELESAEAIATVKEIIGKMPAIYREAILLSYFQRFAYKQIAEMLGIPAGTVKSRLHSGLAYIAREMRKREGPAK